jgi:hypothetical protein
MTPTEPDPEQAFGVCGPVTGRAVTNADLEAIADWGPAEDWSDWVVPPAGERRR